MFKEAYNLSKKGLDIKVIRSVVERYSLSYGLHFYGLKKRIDWQAIRFAFKNLSAYPLISLARSPLKIYSENLYSLNALEVVKMNRVDLVHAHFAYPEGFVGLIIKKRTNKPLVVTVHGYDILVEPSTGYGARLDRRVNAIVRRVLNNADAVIAPSNATFNECIKIMNDISKVHLIPNGVDTKKFSPKTDGSKIKEKFGIEKCTVIFALRNHERHYGLEYLIRAFEQVSMKRKNVALVIGGDGSLKDFHQQLAIDLDIKDKVIFTGRLALLRFRTIML